MSSEVPSGWETVELGDVLSLLRNGFSCSQIPGEGDTPVTRIETIADGDVNPSRVGFTKWDNRLEDYKLEVGDILFSHINSQKHIGKTALYQGGSELYHGMNLMLLRPAQDRVLPSFLIERLRSKSARDFFRSSCRPAVNQASLSKGIIASYRFPLPPLPEQRRITEILSSVDEAIQATQAVIEQTRKVKQGVLNRLLTKGIGHTRFKQTEIGEIPVGWKLTSLDQVTEEMRYGTSVKCDSGEDAFPVLRIPNVINEGIDLSDLKYAEVVPAEAERYTLKEGDLLAVRTNGNPDYIGRMALVPALPGRMLFASYLIRIRVEQSKVLPAWIFYSSLGSLMRKSLLQAARTSAGNFNINSKGLGAAVVTLPPIDEQVAIIRHLEAIDGAIRSSEKKLVALKQLQSAVMSDLLTGRKRVSADLPMAAE